jgi:hypothetical protein
VVFRGPAHDRRAALAAGPDIWEIVSRLQELDGTEQQRITALSEESDLHPRLIRVAMERSSTSSTLPTASSTSRQSCPGTPTTWRRSSPSSSFRKPSTGSPTQWTRSPTWIDSTELLRKELRWLRDQKLRAAVDFIGATGDICDQRREAVKQGTGPSDETVQWHRAQTADPPCIFFVTTTPSN